MNVFRSIRWLLFVAFMATVLSQRGVMAADIPDADCDALEGMKLSVEDVQQLEETLKHKPEDLSIRAKLLGYYSSRHLRSEWMDGIAEREVLWLIEHHPEAWLAGISVYAQFDANFQSVGLSRSRRIVEATGFCSDERAPGFAQRRQLLLAA